jgi:hypothetical protein
MPSLAERLLSRELGSCCGVALHKGWMREAVRKLGVQVTCSKAGMRQMRVGGLKLSRCSDFTGADEQCSTVLYPQH